MALEGIPLRQQAASLLAEREGFEVTELLAGSRRRRQSGGLPQPLSGVPAIRDSDLRSSPCGRQSAARIPSYPPFALLRSDGAAGRDTAQQWPWRESLSPQQAASLLAEREGSKSLNCWQVAVGSPGTCRSSDPGGPFLLIHSPNYLPKEAQFDPGAGAAWGFTLKTEGPAAASTRSPVPMVSQPFTLTAREIFSLTAVILIWPRAVRS